MVSPSTQSWSSSEFVSIPNRDYEELREDGEIEPTQEEIRVSIPNRDYEELRVIVDEAHTMAFYVSIPNRDYEELREFGDPRNPRHISVSIPNRDYEELRARILPSSD